MLGVGCKDAIGSKSAQVQGRVLESVRLDKVRRYQHLIIESVDCTIEVRLVVADLDRRNCAY